MMSRRVFLGRSAGVVTAAALPNLVPASALGVGTRPAPSNRVAVGCIGCGPQGNGVLRNFLGRADAQVVAVCDVNRTRRDATKARVDTHYGTSDCAAYNDFRELVARDDIDACLIASPDHWHVLHALAAVRSGKDVYVEKPLGLSLAEDQALREATHTYGRRFQFGTQQRSSREFRFACELVRNGCIGTLRTIKVGAPASVRSDVYPTMPAPDWLDYDLWLGPAPWAPYTENRIINRFWWHISDYALGFVAGWGIHHVDIAQWGNKADATGPVHIEGVGVFPTEGLCDCATSWNIECRYANGVRMSFTDNTQNTQGVIFEGDEGNVYVRRGFIDAAPKSLLRQTFSPGDERLYESNHHVGNLLDCVKTRAETICSVDIAVRSDTVCHLSDIAMRLRRPLKWDPATERFVRDDEANRMLNRAMRSPWRL
jgi:predicted dehydrogenase